MRIVENKALLVKTAEPKTITSAITKSHLLTKDSSGAEVVVRWGYNEAATLASLPVEDAHRVPSPILKDYKWTGRLTPFDHQKTTASFLSIRKRAFCFNEQGTGKTASVIWAADYLMKMGLVKRVLVLCPLSIMKSAWQQDLFKFAMHRSCDVAHGSAKQRKKVLATKAEFVIINFDGVAVVEDEITAGGFDLVVVDEANAYKNAQTNRWKVLNRIMQATEARLWMLTGTPAAQSPLDAYGLAKLVNPDNTPRYYGTFRDSVMYKVSHFKWAPKPQSEAVVHRVLQPAIRFEKKDCLDLPPVTFTEREAPLTPMQRTYYNELKNEMLVEAAGEDISAVNAAAKINKLLQISGGAVYTDTGEVVEFDVSNRLSAVLEVIEESSNKVLVFVPFTHTIDLLAERLGKEGIDYAVINGKVPVNRRSEIVTDFQTKVNPQVLIIQPQAASHGLTLTAADTIIWYAPVTSVETYLQANARIDRPGQKNNMTIVHIRGSEVESRLYSMLQGNISNHEKIIDLYRQMLGETA
jgi:SNF2 family DNA or RNA helicase